MSDSRRIVRQVGGRPRTVPASAAAERTPDGETLLELAQALAAAMLARDVTAIHQLLGDPRCARLPREVREEAMAFSALPESSTRAPMRMLVHLHRMRELARGGESPPADQMELFAPGSPPGRRHIRLSRDD